MKYKTGDFLKDNEWIFGLLILIIAFSLIIGAIVVGVQNESNRITEGTIVDKQFIPEESYYSGTKDNATYHHNPERHLFLTASIPAVWRKERRNSRILVRGKRGRLHPIDTCKRFYKYCFNCGARMDEEATKK